MTPYAQLNILAHDYAMETGRCWHYLDGGRKYEVTDGFLDWMRGRRIPKVVRRLISESDRDAKRMNYAVR